MTTTAVTPFAGRWVADREHSTFQAGVRHMGVGSFKTTFTDVVARLDARDDGGLRLDGRAQVTSIAIRTPAEFRAHVVDSDEFFAAATHPEIVFASSRVTLSDDGGADVDGELTIKGATVPVSARGSYVAPIEDLYGGRRGALDLTATIDRRDFAITWQKQLPGGGDVVSWNVELTIHLELVEDRC